MAESELGDVMRFLRTVFGVRESHRMFQQDVLRWKCFAPHPFWKGSRGYALRYKGDIAAFGSVVPCRFLTATGTVASCNVIDWAASKAVPSAGILLYKHIQGIAGTMINIGGTDAARQVLPLIGFQARAEIHHCTRVVRPWRHFRQTHPKDWKSPLRLARDYQELGHAVRHGAGALTARRVDRFDSIPAHDLRGPGMTERTPELLNYFLTCPAARIDGYLLERDHTPVGYVLLSRTARECRIADLWIHSADGAPWTDAYATATAVARTDPNTTCITAAASLPVQTGALERAGFRRTHTEPVLVLDPEGRLGDHLAVGLLENDGSYWGV